MTNELQTWDNARVTYDPEAKVWYVYLDKETSGNALIFDHDCDGRPVGFEIMAG